MVRKEKYENIGELPLPANRSSRSRVLTLALLVIGLFFCVFGPFTTTVKAALREVVLKTTEPWKGEFDGMIERRVIRALVAHSKTFYFVDRGQQRGITYEGLTAFEKFVNNKLGKKTLKVNVIIIPVRRDQLIPALVEGRGDLAAANLTITPERLRSVDFSDPFLTDVKELVVTGPAGSALGNLDDLADKEIHVRASSSYYESLQRLNESFRKAGKAPIKLTLADENLEDEDLLEMVNAGLIPMVVVDSHKAQFWAQIFDDIKVHPNIAVNTGGQIAWTFRKNSPKLKAVVNEFVKGHKKGTLLGNIVFNRYLRETKWVKNSLSNEEIRLFRETVGFFKRYADRYGFDWLMVAAQAYQESGIDQSKRSPMGAIGVMQVLSSTAADPNVSIPNIEELENNIHAGVKYMRFIMDRYFKDAEMDDLNRNLFAFASYNAGPARISGLRRQAVRDGLDPNVWFHNVEVVAAKEIGRETVQYVSNIYKYYVAYRLIVDRLQTKKAVKESKPAP
jgi:membrane-bound lytic murein transglycosylase MltF